MAKLAACLPLGLLLAILLPCCQFMISQIPDHAVIISQTQKLDTELLEFIDKASGIDQFKKAYNDKKDDIIFDETDGAQMVQDLAQKLGELLSKKIAALNESVTTAEMIAADYKWNTALTLETVNYTKAKEVNASDPAYVYSEQFKQKINPNTSSVHIPVEIYEGDIEILNGLQWTSGLEEQWRKNREKDPTLLWQYFGSQTGIMRNYPASKWKDDGVDMYDVRRRPWYTQGASSPKDMLILVDTSGSTHGQALALMKEAAISLMNTLGENDFVNVAHFSDVANWVGCFQSFIQATYRNKQVLEQYVGEIQAGGMASYSKGFEFAFNQFLMFDRDENRTEGEGANCNRIIMFLTDGGTEMPEEVFDKYNHPEAKIRIFGYAVGPTANPVAAVKWIACTNRGYFYRIPAMGAIRSTVQDFYKYIGLGLTDDFIREPIVPNIYKDQWHYSNILGRSTALGAFSQSALWTNIQAPFHQGMGMMTTVTLPVYNRTNDIANQTILGVMGCDVTVEEMSHFVDKRQLGPNGYDFAINSNGYIVFHPNLKATNGWLKNPPNVDFLEVEYETEAKVEMRMHMIDGETGSANIQTYVVLPDELHVDNASRTYYYTFVPDSTFSVGVVLPDYATKFIKSVKTFTDVAQGIELLRSLDTDLILADWDYCSELMPVADSNSSNWVEDVINTFEFGYHKCNQDLAQHLFLDAGIAEGMVSYWRDKAPEKIEAAFVATNAGLTKIFPAGTNSSFERLSDPWKAVYYKRSFDNDLWMFSADIVRAEENYTTIMASKAIEIEDAGYKPAVIGVLLSQATLIKQVTDQMKACKNLQTKCYLLDDGGFIMMSTNEEEDSKVIGKFFGETERDVMAHMINTSVFIQNEQYDYQGACQEVRKIASAGTTLISPIFYDMLSLNWWTAKFAWAYLNFNLYNWLFPVRNYVYADGEDEEMTELSNYSCILKLSQYHYNTQQEFSDSKGMITCSSCQKSYATSRIMSTNLLLVMVEGIEDCNRACTHNPLPLQPKESTDPNFSNDECIVTKRYRKRPPCYDYNEHENTSLCGSCSLLYPCPVLLLLASLCLVLIQRQNL